MEEKTNSLKEVKVKKIPKLDMSNDKKVISIIVGSVIIIALGIFAWFYYNNNLKPVVKFDGGSLTSSEFSIYYRTFAPMLEQYGYGPNEIPTEIANKAGVDKILLLKARDAGIKLSDSDREKVDKIFNDEEQIKQFTNNGIDPVKMKQLYYNDYIITAYIEKMKTDLPEEEVIAYLKTTYGENIDMTEFVTRHILFSTIDPQTNQAMTEEQKVEVKAKAEAALARVLAGEDFATLAKELSDDTGTKEGGGLYKLYLDENTVAEYREAVKTLAIGSTTTSLIEVSYGYHIIKLDEKVEGGRVNSDNDRTQIASTKINGMGKEKNMEINKAVLAKVVESITGVKAVEETPDEDTTGENMEEETLPQEHVHDENCTHE